MQPLPADFLRQTAQRYDLSFEQTQALVQRLSQGQTEQVDAEALHISVNALRSRMSGVYKKFSIGGKGPGKLQKLHDLLWAEFRKTQPQAAAIVPPAENTIDALVQTVRQQVHGDIAYRCGSMRVLDMEQKIDIDDVYTSVNILEKLSGHRRLRLNELRQDSNLENFDRLVLGQVQHKRLPGLEAVDRYAALMVLGKPGAGKTTFMKRLATLCNGGKFQPRRVPVFVTLKEFAEAGGKPGLETFIAQQWRTCGVVDGDALPAVLQKGRALILLDGLDEVQEAEHDRTLQAIKAFTNQYHGCQFVMTCRIAAWEYTFQQFTEVEVADFDAEQIADFAGKWFWAKQDPEKGRNFIQRLKNNKPIQELATNPLLLTLLCLVFGEAGDFPANRAELYKEGLDVLLKKWDAKRKIERDQIYKKLSLKRKEDLLSQLAFSTFTRGDYFFTQNVVERHIIDYIRNLPGVSEDEEILLLDSEAVLKSIEAQHGLLVERARGIYSFSHLTFQEYFTAQHITNRPYNLLGLTLADLAKCTVEKRYREILLLATNMISEADTLLKLIKQQADFLLADDPKLQIFLQWIHKKSQSVNSPYKPSAVRAFYFSLVSALARAIAQAHTQVRIRVLDLTCDFTSARGLNLPVDIALVQDINLALDFSLARILVRAYAFDLAHALAHALALARDLYQEARRASVSDPTLKSKIEHLVAKLPRIGNEEAFNQLQKEQGKSWSEQLRAVMLEHRNIGYDWQFTETQKEKLQQYYDANKLLVDCLNSDCYVTKATRQHIEDTLLLPIDSPPPQP